MTVEIQFPITQDLATNHWGIPQGDTGRGGNQIVGICLHALEYTMERYVAYLHSPRARTDIRPAEHGSVNYGIEADGTIRQFVLDSNTAWGIQQLVGSDWELLGDFAGIEPNYLFLHIGVEFFISPSMPHLMFQSLAELIARLCDEHSIAADSDHIISHFILEDTFSECEEGLAVNLLATVQSILAQGTGGVTTNVALLALQVAALQTQVDTLSGQVSASLSTIATYASHVTTLAGASVLGHVKSSAGIGVDGSGVLTVRQLAAAYAVNPLLPQPIAPNITAVVQFPVLLLDQTPAWMTVGAFQRMSAGVVGLYRVYARLHFNFATWSAGKVLHLELWRNGVIIMPMCKFTIEAALTSKEVEVQGEAVIVVSNSADYYDIRLTLDDGNGIKSITEGIVLMERIGA